MAVQAPASSLAGTTHSPTLILQPFDWTNLSARSNMHAQLQHILAGARLQPDAPDFPDNGGLPPQRDALLVLLPLLIVLSTFLFLLLLFLVCVLLIRRRRGIVLRDSDGPVDMSREELVEGEGGFEGVESRWMESVPESVRRAYQRSKDWQMQYPPNSLPTDITLSQFLSIQEKGVSAWSFEPDYETVNSLLVHARTEITFLPDPASSSCVQSNLPLPKLNEVYYWEVKMFDLPPTTVVAVGLATKPYPAFRLPGVARYSVAYHSTGDKSHNYPFTASSFGPALKEGDVLGVGYRPRTGTVFFTRNGRKMDDAFVGLGRWNLFPTIGADGPCSVHVNLGQAGFVFIEANVKKWGLAPSVGTLAPPPAYGSERGSILLDVGGRPSAASNTGSPALSASPVPSSRRLHRSRRPKHSHNAVANATSPLRSPPMPMTPPPPITPIDEEDSTIPPAVVEAAEDEGTPSAGPSSSSRRYISPTDMPFHNPPASAAHLPHTPPPVEEEHEQEHNDGDTASSDDETTPSASRSASPSSSRTATSLTRAAEGASAADGRGTTRSLFSTPRSRPPPFTHVARLSDPGPSPPPAPVADAREEELRVHLQPPPDSPRTPNPPTPNQLDIRLQSLGHSADQLAADSATLARRRDGAASAAVPVGLGVEDGYQAAEPPAYSPLDAYTYADGVQLDLPAEVIAAAIEGGTLPASIIGQAASGSGRNERRRSRRR